MQKWNIALKIQKECPLQLFMNKLETVERSLHIILVKKRIPDEIFREYPPLLNNYKIAIIDFEGAPVFMCGILIKDTILIYYIENLAYRNDLYLLIFNLLNISQELSFFAFSNYERTELLNIYYYLQVQGYDISEFTFIETFPIINLQNKDSNFESLQEAIYSIHLNSVKMTGDPLFRNNKLVNQLFNAHKFEELISHNINCLLNESVIFLKRWYKNYKI